jgi:large subunit ribosomal protein L21
MYAVIETGGKQYRVSPGDSIRVETIEGAEAGATVEFGGLLAASNATGELLTGPSLSNAKVVATVKGAGRADKIIVFKFKRKKQYRRTYGHRQNYTELTVSDIVL